MLLIGLEWTAQTMGLSKCTFMSQWLLSVLGWGLAQVLVVSTSLKVHLVM